MQEFFSGHMFFGRQEESSCVSFSFSTTVSEDLELGFYTMAAPSDPVL